MDLLNDLLVRRSIAPGESGARFPKADGATAIGGIFSESSAILFPYTTGSMSPEQMRTYSGI